MIKILKFSLILNFLVIITNNQSTTTINAIETTTANLIGEQTTTSFIDYGAPPTDPLNSIKYVIDDDIITNISVNINIIRSFWHYLFFRFQQIKFFVLILFFNY